MNIAGIKITRFPYEEPYHLRLYIEASNGNLKGRLEYYCVADDLEKLGKKLGAYLGNQGESVVYELGSEGPQKRFAYFLSIKVMPLDLAGHSVICLHFNNNCLPPSSEISEFCIRVDVADINRLGSLLVGFGKLDHQVLYWSVKDGKLFKNIEDFNTMG